MEAGSGTVAFWIPIDVMIPFTFGVTASAQTLAVSVPHAALAKLR